MSSGSRFSKSFSAKRWQILNWQFEAVWIELEIRFEFFEKYFGKTVRNNDLAIRTELVDA